VPLSKRPCLNAGSRGESQGLLESVSVAVEWSMGMRIVDYDWSLVQQISTNTIAIF